MCVHHLGDLLVSFLGQVDSIPREKPVEVFLGQTVEFGVEVYERCLLLRRNVVNGLDI